MRQNKAILAAQGQYARAYPEVQFASYIDQAGRFFAESAKKASSAKRRATLLCCRCKR
jgi:hypothetical protein